MYIYLYETDFKKKILSYLFCFFPAAANVSAPPRAKYTRQHERLRGSSSRARVHFFAYLYTVSARKSTTQEGKAYENVTETNVFGG